MTQGPFKDWVDFEGRKCLVRGNDWDPTGRGAMTGMSILCFSDIQSLNHSIKIQNQVRWPSLESVFKPQVSMSS